MSLYIYPNPETIQTPRMNPVKQGSPTPGPRTGASPQPVRNWATAGGEWRPGEQVKPHLPLPIAHTTTWTISPRLQSLRTMSSMKPVPGARKVGDHCCKAWTWRDADVSVQAHWSLTTDHCGARHWCWRKVCTSVGGGCGDSMHFLLRTGNCSKNESWLF